jgi:NADH:ubiquinone oxidoreductase subunit 3 (subunit A)
VIGDAPSMQYLGILLVYLSMDVCMIMGYVWLVKTMNVSGKYKNMTPVTIYLLRLLPR